MSPGRRPACHPSGLFLVGAGYGLEQCGFAREPFISSNIYLGSDMLYFTYSPGEHAWTEKNTHEAMHGNSEFALEQFLSDHNGNGA